MNTGLLIGLMFACGILMMAMPVVCFMIANIVMGQGITPFVLIMTFLIILLLTFLLSAGSFAYMQYDACKKVKNTTQIFTNAGIAVAIQLVSLLFVGITGWTSIPKQMLPETVPYLVREGLGYGYYTFFATMYGIVLGGTLSSIC